MLILVTLAAFAVTPFLGDDPTDPLAAMSTVSAPVVSPHAVEKESLPPKVVYPLRGGRASAGLRPVRLKQVTVGVASMNMYRQLSGDQAAHDARTLTRQSAVDVVGWQEANRFGAELHALPGWDTKTFQYGRRNSELAVSWRSKEFKLLSAHQVQVAYGVGSGFGRYPFGNRLVAVVTLEHKDTGRRLTIINSHLPQKIENLNRPGRWMRTINAYRARNQLQRIVGIWKNVPSRWIVGTGDYNFDALADARHRLGGAPRRAYDGTAVSSYQRLGFNVAPTYPENGRRIDYVWADRQAYADGRMRFTHQWVVGNLNSDHNALVAQLNLR
jgi:endonuclease/exonuclease/phosphatase family metal-dependent hydrolase